MNAETVENISNKPSLTVHGRIPIIQYNVFRETLKRGQISTLRELSLPRDHQSVIHSGKAFQT